MTNSSPKFPLESILYPKISKGFRPRQILVEFDELNVPSRRGFERVTEINQILINNNYKLIKTDGKADFLYLKN